MHDRGDHRRECNWPEAGQMAFLFHEMRMVGITKEREKKKKHIHFDEHVVPDAIHPGAVHALLGYFTHCC